jgi:hypothetical protein
VAKAWQGRRFDAGGAAAPERTGPRVSDVVMSAVMADVASRVPPRDARPRQARGNPAVRPRLRAPEYATCRLESGSNGGQTI